MTIALTGATGFVGQAVLDQAAQSDETVRALTRRAQAPRANVEWVAGDLSDTAALAALCEPCDAIVHVAGLTNAPDPAAFEEANVDGTARLIAAARHSRAKRFVFVSSLSAREPGLSAYGASTSFSARAFEAP